MEEGFEEVVEGGALAAVEVYCAVDGVKDGDDFSLFVDRRDRNSYASERISIKCGYTHARRKSREIKLVEKVGDKTLVVSEKICGVQRRVEWPVWPC